MIKGNIIKFGYGDVVVGSDKLYNVLIIRNFKPTQEVGQSITDETCIEYLDQINIILTYEDCRLMLGKLKDIGINNLTFEIKGHIFDFIKYNQKSVDVVRTHVESIMKQHLFYMAC